MNKKGMEFAVGTFVGIVMGMAMFIAGAAIFWNIYDSATQMTESVDERAREQTLRQFTDGSLVFLPETSITPRGRDSNVRLYFAVSNIYPAAHNFNVVVKHVVDSGLDCNCITVLDEIRVPGGNREVGLIIVDTSDLASGEQHVFNVSVTNETSTPYGRTRIFTVNT